MKSKEKLKALAWRATCLLTGFLLLCSCGNSKPLNPNRPNDGGNQGSSSTGEYNEEHAFNIVSYNVWVQQSGDGAWSKRKDYIKKRMDDHEADIIAMQEVMRPFVEDLKTMFPDFSIYGMGRDSGGEGCDIMWKTERFSRTGSGQFWYSDTPEYSSNGWDGKYSRICTWVKLRDKKSGKEFYVFNSHMALSLDGRNKSSALLIEKVAEIAGDTPYYCTGDFNSEPLEAPMVTLRTVMNDAFLIADKKEGPSQPANGFTFPSQADFSQPTKRIDFCLMSKGAKAYLCKVIADDITEQVRASDHLPLLVRTVPSTD